MCVCERERERERGHIRRRGGKVVRIIRRNSKRN